MYLEKKKRNKALAVMAVLLVLAAGGIAATMHTGKHESIKETMRDAVLHDLNRISVFGLFEADPSLVSGFIVTALMLFIAFVCSVFGFLMFCASSITQINQSSSKNKSKSRRTTP